MARRRFPSVPLLSFVIRTFWTGGLGSASRAAWGHVSVLEGGGHICELVSHKHGARQSFMEANVEDHRPVHVHTRQAHPSLWTAA